MKRWVICTLVRISNELTDSRGMVGLVLGVDERKRSSLLRCR